VQLTLGLVSKALDCSFQYEFEGNESPPEFEGNLDHNSLILAKQMRRKAKNSRLWLTALSCSNKKRPKLGRRLRTRPKHFERIRKKMEEQRAKEEEEKTRLMQRRL
jgi:hypothetical protein